jgi:hypothetical protein
MPYKSEKIPVGKKLDKRIKLTDEQRERIREEYATGLISQRGLAEKYGVSRRLIQFTLDDEKKERAKKQFAERQKTGRYYDKDKHKEYMKIHRRRKHELYKEGKIGEDEE